MSRFGSHVYKKGSSKAMQDVQTPLWLYEKLNEKYQFDHDPCPYFGKFNSNVPDGLTSEWGSSNFVNPPYTETKKWLQKGVEELKKGKLSCFLIPCRFTKYILKFYSFASEVFIISPSPIFPPYNLPFPEPIQVVVFDPNSEKKIGIEKIGSEIFGKKEKEREYNWVKLA